MSDAALSVEYHPEQGRRRRIEYKKRSCGGYVRVVSHRRHGHWHQIGSETVSQLSFQLFQDDELVAGRVVDDE